MMFAECGGVDLNSLTSAIVRPIGKSCGHNLLAINKSGRNIKEIFMPINLKIVITIIIKHV